jgi:uncharacterized protein YlxW (UPF0749 family)
MFKKMTDMKRANWKCNVCVKEDPRSMTTRSKTSGGESEEALVDDGSFQGGSCLQDNVDLQERIVEGVTKRLKAFMAKELSAVKREMNAALEDIKATISFLSEEYDDLNKKVSALTAAVKNQSILEAEITSMSRRVEELERREEVSKQAALKADIEVFGLPKQKEEDLRLFVKKMADEVQFDFKEEDILDVYRQQRRDDKPGSIIIRMISASSREGFLSLLKTRKSVGENETKLFFNEHLTRKNKYIYREARTKARELKFRFVWVKNGNIFAREGPGSRVYKIQTLRDIELLKSEVSLRENVTLV